jgi:hypothetical protein
VKLLLVCGAWGSGTSALAGLLSRLHVVGFGPYFPIYDPNTASSYELQPFRDALLPFVSEETLSLKANAERDVEANLLRLRERIEKRNLGPYDEARPIFLKYPLSALVMPQICNVFRSTRLIYVLRPLAGIEQTRLRRGWEPQMGKQGAEVIYSHMFHFLIELTYPTMLVRYSELLSAPTVIAQRLVEFAELSATPAEIREAAAWIRPSNSTLSQWDNAIPIAF